MAAPATESNPLLAAGGGIVLASSAFVLQHYRIGERARSYTLAKDAPESVQKILEKCSALAHMEQKKFLVSLDNFSILNPQSSRVFFENHLAKNFQPQHRKATTETLGELVALVKQAIPACLKGQDPKFRNTVMENLQLLDSLPLLG